MAPSTRPAAREVLAEWALQRGMVVERPTIASVNAMAQSFRAQWEQGLERVQPPAFEVPRPAVLWLAGKRISSGALAFVWRWRRAGVDVRTLEIEARRSPTAWWLRVMRKDAPLRDRLDALIDERAADYAAEPGTHVLKSGTYPTARPTDASGTGGELADPPPRPRS